MIDSKDLCRAMQAVVNKRKELPLKEEEIRQDKGVYELFSSVSPRFEQVPNALHLIERPIDVRLRARWQVSRLLDRKAGTDWREWDIQTLIDWLMENWKTVLQVLLTLIMVVI